MHHPAPRLTLLGAVAAVIAGCAAPAGPLSLSISELGSEVQEDAGSLTAAIKHRRSHNITGLGSADTIGMLSADPDPPLLFRWPNLFSNRHLPDQMAPRIQPQCSKVVVRDLPMGPDKGLPEVLALRDSLQSLHAAELSRLRLSAEAALVTEIIAVHPAAGAAPAAVPKAADQGALQQYTALVEAWRGLSSAGAPPADKAGWTTLLANLRTQEAGAQTKVESEAQRFQSARSEQGLIVARWEYEASKKGGVEATGVAASSRESSQRSGFVVLGHPRTMTLVAGNDLVSRACRAKDATCTGIDPNQRQGIDSMIPSRRIYTTTFQLLAEHVAWAESGLEEQQHALALQLSEVAKTLGGAGLGSLQAKLQALQINLTSASQARTSAENLGAVSGAHQWDQSFSFWSDDAYSRSVAYLRALNGNFLPVSSMRTTLDAYAEHYGANQTRPAQDCSDQAPSADELARLVSAQLGCRHMAEPAYLRTMDASTLASHREACLRIDGSAPSLQALVTWQP